MFRMKFKVVEIYPSGLTVTHYLEGWKKDVKADIEMFKKNAKSYEFFGNKGMVVRV